MSFRYSSFFRHFTVINYEKHCIYNVVSYRNTQARRLLFPDDINYEDWQLSQEDIIMKTSKSSHIKLAVIVMMDGLPHSQGC